MFGRGRTWNGKCFSSTTNYYEKENTFSSSPTAILGFNRFVSRQSPQQSVSSAATALGIEKDQIFSASIGKSKLNDNLSAVVLDYSTTAATTPDSKSASSSSDSCDNDVLSKQQRKILSPWYSMHDELRYIPIADDYSVLLGFGCMGWSGGIRNAAPFCLYRKSL